MKFVLHSDLLTLFPELQYGIIIFRDLNNKSVSKEPYALLKQVMEHHQDLLSNPAIEFWKQAFAKAQINAENYPPSIVALAKRIKEAPLASVNPIVDLYNSVSIKYAIPMGGYDMSTLKEDLTIRLSQEGDTFLPMGKKETENVEPGIPVFAMDSQVLCTRWAWKQDDLHKVTDRTSNLLMRIEGYGRSREELEKIMEETTALIQKYCGGSSTMFVVDKKHPTEKIAKEFQAIERKKTKQDILIEEVMNRGVVDIIVRQDLETRLHSGKKLRIKLGIDPTGSDLHIGHMVVVKKLAELQKLGHHILLLFGNFTGQIGDPTGKSQVRNRLTQEQLEKNAEGYLKQVSKVLDIKNVEVVWNADWLGPLRFGDVTGLASLFTVSQMLERDMFQDRMKSEKPIYVHEFLYPLMQGYDSVALKADIELGGTDQTFNLLAGRTIQKAYGQEPQSIITVPILEGLDGHRKMGKSENNYIGVMEEPGQQYGKVMSIPDTLIMRYFELATNVPLAELESIKKDLAGGGNPRDIKMRLAREIVTLYHGEKAAQEAEEQFIQVFQKRELPDEMPEAKVESGANIIEVLVKHGLVESKSDARRMIEQNGVSFNDEKISSIDFTIQEGGVIRVGKRRFLRIHV